MGRERGSAESYDPALLYPAEDERRVFGNFLHESVGKVDPFSPFVAFHGYFDMGHPVSGEVLPGGHGLHRPGNGRMHEGGDESAGFGYDLAGLDLVADGDDGFRRCAEVLGHGHVNCRRQGQDLGNASACGLGVIRMDATYGKRNLTH